MAVYLPNSMLPLLTSLHDMERFASPLAGLPSVPSPVPATPPRSSAFSPRWERTVVDGADVLRVELPGFDKTDVTLDVKGTALRVSAGHAQPARTQTGGPGERASARAAGDPAGAAGSLPAAEDGSAGDAAEGPRCSRRYCMTVALPKNADVGAIRADMANGLLTVTVPHQRPEATQGPVRIAIQ